MDNKEINEIQEETENIQLEKGMLVNSCAMGSGRIIGFWHGGVIVTYSHLRQDLFAEVHYTRLDFFKFLCVYNKDESKFIWQPPWRKKCQS